MNYSVLYPLRKYQKLNLVSEYFLVWLYLGRNLIKIGPCLYFVVSRIMGFWTSRMFYLLIFASMFAFVYFCQIKPSEAPAIVVLSSYRLRVSWHTHKEQSNICWRLMHLVLLTGAAEMNKPYCLTQKSGNFSGVEAAQEFSPRLSMLLSIWWMDTLAIRSLTQLLRSVRSEGGRAFGAWFGLSS